MLAALLSVSLAVAAPCSAPTRLDDLHGHLDAAVHAWVTRDLSSFRTSATAARDLLPCLADTVDPASAARILFQEGLLSWADRDEASSILAFRGLLAMEPTWVLPEPFAPASHPLQAVVARARVAAPPGTRPVPAPRRGTIRVDGVPADTLPDTCPAVVQWVRADGGIGFTAYVRPGDPLPEYPMRKR